MTLNKIKFIIREYISYIHCLDTEITLQSTSQKIFSSRLLITVMWIVSKMTELTLIDYFIMGEAVGIITTFIVSLYYSRKQMQKLSTEIDNESNDKNTPNCV